MVTKRKTALKKKVSKMVTKDWKKSRESFGNGGTVWVKSSNGNKWIGIAPHDATVEGKKLPRKWSVQGGIGIGNHRFFRTKTEALAFAKRYMKKY